MGGEFKGLGVWIILWDVVWGRLVLRYLFLLGAVKKLQYRCYNFFNGQDLILFSLFFIKHLKPDLDH